MDGSVFSCKKGPAGAGPYETVSAAETANLAENLPDGAALIIAAVAAREEEHLADLLFSICLAKTRGIIPHRQVKYKL